MAIPKYNEMYAAWFRALKDGQVHHINEIKEYIKEEFKLTDEEIAQKLPSGKQSIFANRVGWAKTYLKKAGLIESPIRGKCVLTKEGKRVLPQAELINNDFLMKYTGFQEFISTSKKLENIKNDDNYEEKSPLENFEEAYHQINDTLADELMEEVMALAPVQFEKLVIELLLKMGYGSGIDDAGVVTQQSSDGGIDGIIKEDQLGFSSIYIQAKRWDKNATVSRPEVQKFAGALQGEKASKGLFITTGKFTAGAKEYAQTLHGSTIVLIDGIQLMKLMIKYNLGVSVQHTYEIKKIDTDFFRDEI